MPMYDFQCTSGHKFERMVPLAEFEVTQFCSCNLPATRLISRPMFMVENVGYDCPVTGKWINSKREHLNNLSEHGCRVLETGEKELNAARKDAADQEFERKLDETVEREIDTWSSAKKEQLHNELVNGGVDLAVERTAPNG